MNPNSLLSMQQLNKDDIIHILNEALQFDMTYKDWHLPLQKALVANLFFEPSTRTHYSFESAQLQLGIQAVDVDVKGSSLNKGESLYDTVKTLESVGYDAVVIRHPKDRYYDELEGISIPIINAGDGAGSHPTQCLLDLLTIYREFGGFEGLKVLICGDILHSRVASSAHDAFTRMGCDVKFTGPSIWEREGYPTVDFDEAVSEMDVVMMLRIQKERGAAIGEMTDEEYLKTYGMSKEREARMKKGAIIMHPAPVNRGVEIDTDLVECGRSRIFPQMYNGMLVRKAVMKRAFGVEEW